MSKNITPPVFRDVDEYYSFSMKYKVFGKDAVKLKESMDKEEKKHLKA